MMEKTDTKFKYVKSFFKYLIISNKLILIIILLHSTEYHQKISFEQIYNIQRVFIVVVFKTSYMNLK